MLYLGKVIIKHKIVKGRNNQSVVKVPFQE